MNNSILKQNFEINFLIKPSFWFGDRVHVTQLRLFDRATLIVMFYFG